MMDSWVTTCHLDRLSVYLNEDSERMGPIIHKNHYIMTLLLWLAVGLVAGILAKRTMPNMSTSNWAFAALIAIVGAFFGGFAGEISGAGQTYLAEGVVAVIGAVTVLYFYRQYLSDYNTGV